MTYPWNEGVLGTQVPVLINLDAATIRCVAGPGSGKTFGLIRRVERILHPAGLGAGGRQVLVVAFNRVIAQQLRDEIAVRLKSFDCDPGPVIQTIHALCVQVIGEDLRMLLPHEVDAMIYDLLQEYPEVSNIYHSFRDAGRAIREHDAGHAEHLVLWMAGQEWLVRHKAHLVGDLPRLLLERLKGGDFPEQGYDYVIVDEFQDLTRGEQELVFRLRRPGGQFLALGDPRQSIYKFRGNDPQGLANIETLLDPDGTVHDVTITECQRCPTSIVLAANQLMALSGSEAMVPVSDVQANIHVVTWLTPEAEATGMAAAIVNNTHARPGDRHLVMVTRRQFGYWLRDGIAALDPALRVELGFSEGLLESWAAREAFLLFCLILGPDPPTWRAWLGYRTSATGRNFTAPRRSTGAYLQVLKGANDAITDGVIEALVAEPREKPRGDGGLALWDRAKRFLDLRSNFPWDGQDAAGMVNSLFDPNAWVGAGYDPDRIPGATMDLQLLREKALALLKHEQERRPGDQPAQHLQGVVERLRHQIATNEPLATGEPSNLHVATLWGAKGVTAEHVYILGACQEALPGLRREEYPGTDAEYRKEQRRLFYVSITRAKRTLVISRALRVRRGAAQQMGLTVTTGNKYWPDLRMSPYLREIMGVLSPAVEGPSWMGCVPA
jgi:hypothetical protein